MKRQILIYGLFSLLTAGGVTVIAIANHHNTGMQSSSANDMHHNSEHDGHGNNRDNQEKDDTKAILTVDRAINPNQPTILKFDIQDKDGKKITDFDIFQEKFMHLIVVSDDLQLFNHLHPEKQKDGNFEVETSFPQGGNYSLFVDYKPKGKSERVSVLNTQVLGKPNSTNNIVDLTTTKTIDNTKVNLSFIPPIIEAGKEVHLVFNLQDTKTNLPPEDLQLYLGELGHLVILKQSSPLTQQDYIHAHGMKNTPKGEIHFMAKFPRSGKYKMWGQFDRNGKIIVADFWVDVR
jgi:hypothetical protein